MIGATEKASLSNKKWTAAGICAAILSCAIVSVLSSKVTVFNADAIASVYMVKGSPILGQMFFADWHTNILKLPILFIQALFPYNLFSFIAVNFLLLLTMLLGWAAATAMNFGRRCFVPVCLVLSLLFMSSYMFIQETGFVTIRNIEYPLYFILISLFWRLIARKGINSRTYLPVYIIFGVILLASDPFFTYTMILPLLAVLIWKLHSKAFGLRTFLYGIALLAVPVIGGKITIRLLEAIHLFQYYGQSLTPVIFPFDKLPLAFWTGLHDLVSLYGADLFSRPVSLESGFRLCLLVILIGSITSFVVALRNGREYLDKKPAYLTLLLSGLLAFVMYCLTYSLYSQRRYIAVLILIFTTTLTPHIIRVLVASKRNLHYLAYWYPVLFVAFAGFLYHIYATNYFAPYERDKANIEQLNTLLQQQGVNTVIAGHSYASPIRFWSHDHIQAVPVLFCNQNLPFLVREQWYTPTSSTKNVAIIYDRTGRDANSWACGEQSLLTYYGKPEVSFETQGIDGQPVKVFIYGRRVITKIHIVRQTGEPRPLIN